MDRSITLYSKGFSIEAKGDIALIIAIAIAFLLICQGLKAFNSVSI